MPIIVVVGASRGLLPVIQRGFPDHRVIVVDTSTLWALPAGFELLQYDVQDPANAALVAAELRRRGRIMAVVPALEYPSVFAAVLADSLGLPGATSYAAATLRDKGLLRQRTAATVRSPEYRLVRDIEDARSFIAKVSSPWLVKPTNRQGGSGVRVVYKPGELERAWDIARAPDPKGPELRQRGESRILIERFVLGRELSVEAIVNDGCIAFTNICETQIFDTDATRIEEGHVAPADVSAEERASLLTELRKLIDVIGFKTGILHAEWVLNQDGPHLIECAGRLPGDSIAELVSYAHGFDLVKAYVRTLCGTPTPMPQRPGRVFGVRFLRGVVPSAARLPHVATLPGVVRAEIAEDAVESERFEASWDRSGFVIATGDSHRELDELLTRAATELTGNP